MAELLVILIVALLVFGPRQLTRMAYFVGHLLQRGKRFMLQMKRDLDEQMTVDGIQDSLQKNQQAMREQKLPGETPPVEPAPVKSPPSETPPLENPPSPAPPTEIPPMENPPGETPPAETPP